MEQGFHKRRRQNPTVTELPETMIFGRNAVIELLKSGRSVDKIWIREGEREGSLKFIGAQAAARGIPVISVSRTKLDEMTCNLPHQGVVAMAAERDYCSLDDILDYAAQRGEKPLIVIADGIEDPHNLGAIIRTANQAGAHGVIIPKRRAVGLTATVARTSAGALNYTPVAKVTNLVKTMEDL